MKKVTSVYTHLMTTIYLSLSAQVAEGAIFRKYCYPGNTVLLTSKRKVYLCYSNIFSCVHQVYYMYYMAENGYL